MTIIYGLFLTLCINGECNTTIPESYYSMEDCVNVLKEIDRRMAFDQHIVSFKCEEIEE